MPGFGTSERTKANAVRLMEALGVTWRELDIRPAARQMLADLGHPFARGEPVYDVTFENVQAGLRTDYLFRLANHHKGFVLGTGDLSELALGWCTYGVGDQMSHYNVNAGVPKTLIQHLIRWVIASRQFEQPVLDTLAGHPRHGDLARAGAGGRAGPDPEHRDQDRPLRAAGLQPILCAPLRLPSLQDRLSGAARVGRRRIGANGRPASPRNGDTPIRWLRSAAGCGVFLARFFGFAQFKRSALPNGPKVAAGGSLSPRGDWRAPSDGNARIWLEELEREVPEA